MTRTDSSSGLFWPLQPANGSCGTLVKLASNFFQIACDSKEKLYTYEIDIKPELRHVSASVRGSVETRINSMLTSYAPFFRKGRKLYSRASHADSITQVFEDIPDGHGKTITFMISIRVINGGLPIPSDSQTMHVLYKYILSKLAGFKQYQRLGDLYYNKPSLKDEDRMQIIGGFTCRVGFMADIGHYLTVDTMYRAVHRKNILESMLSNIEYLMTGESSSIAGPPTQADINAEWTRRCENAIVIGHNNGKVYRLKKVRFDLHPSSLFKLKQKKSSASKAATSSGQKGAVSTIIDSSGSAATSAPTRQYVEMSYTDYYRRFYNRIIYDQNQPLLEAYSERSSETVILIPELCALTGLTEEMRKDRMLMQEVLQYSRVGTGDKLNQSVAICRELYNGAAATMAAAPPSIDPVASVSVRSRSLMKEWGCMLSQVPARVEARVLDPCEVSFDVMGNGCRRYVVEDGNFQRWTRSGSNGGTSNQPHSVNLSRWLVIHHEHDRQLVDMWLRSMREIGGSGFGMHLAEPLRILINGNPEELKRILMDQVTPDVQLVMLFTQQKDSKKIYQVFKHVTTTARPCITQVVKSETMRKRQSVVAIVTRVVMQISAKILGPLWHINLDSPLTPMMHEPTMVVGIDAYESKEYPRKSVIGFVASIDAFVSQYFSTSVILEASPTENALTHPDFVSQKIRKCMHDAFEAFADANDGILPTNIIVYRNNVSRYPMKQVGQYEVEAILDSIKATNSETWDHHGHHTVSGTNTGKECAYDPALTYIMCMSHVPARFFLMGSPDGARNPPPGTVIDTVLPGSDAYSFYLVNQHVSRGSAAPTQYVVGYESSQFTVDAIQNLTFRLSHMYYNFPGGVRLPAPAQYAKKLAHMVATSVQADVHPRLNGSLYYL